MTARETLRYAGGSYQLDHADLERPIGAALETAGSRVVGTAHTVVELAHVEPRDVTAAIASALGIGASAEATMEYLRVTPMLVVLDTCEHVLTPVSAFVETALDGCPDLRVLATSRRRIGLHGEQVLPIGPLCTPGPDTNPAAARLTAALRLFVDRARHVRPSFAPLPADVLAVAEVCRRLDGVPLAIELAATRAASLGVEAVRDRLANSLDLLDGDGERHEPSLRTALEWSYALLDPSEQLLPRRATFVARSDGRWRRATPRS